MKIAERFSVQEKPYFSVYPWVKARGFTLLALSRIFGIENLALKRRVLNPSEIFNKNDPFRKN
jgi:hypothetical protein